MFFLSAGAMVFGGITRIDPIMILGLFSMIVFGFKKTDNYAHHSFRGTGYSEQLSIWGCIQGAYLTLSFIIGIPLLIGIIIHSLVT